MSDDAPEPRPSGPLSGLTVLELAGLGPAPFACMTLAELGADVIRIDRPRKAAPVLTANLLDRGKRSIVLDLKNPDAVQALLALVERADVLIEAYRPGVAERLGVGPDVALQHNPALVYGRMTGWGQTGPLASTAGHDIGYIAITGALHAIGPADGPPQIPLNLLGDFGGGATYLVMGVLAAVLEARSTGRGQVVDAAIVDGTAQLLSAMHALMAQGRWVDRPSSNLLDGGTPYYSVYGTADGRWMAVGALEPQFYAELVRLLELDVDPADQLDTQQWPALRQQLTTAFVGRTQGEWTEVFDGTDACVAPILSMTEAAAHPHMAARGSLVEHDGVLQSGPAPRFSGHPGQGRQSPPELGAHTREVLAAVGYEHLAD